MIKAESLCWLRSDSSQAAIKIWLNTDNGKVAITIPIGDGCDGVAFNKMQKIIFTSNGEGTMSAIQEGTNDQFTSLANFKTKRGARTITINEKKNTIYLPTAEFDPVAKKCKRPAINDSGNIPGIGRSIM